MTVYVLYCIMHPGLCKLLGVYSSLEAARAAAKIIHERHTALRLEEWGAGMVRDRLFWSAGDYEIEWFTVDAPPYEP